ncbi:MAG: hypothetical protein ACREV2_04000, partial [Burkholderiales bacterium]
MNKVTTVGIDLAKRVSRCVGCVNAMNCLGSWRSCTANRSDWRFEDPDQLGVSNGASGPSKSVTPGAITGFREFESKKRSAKGQP